MRNSMLKKICSTTCAFLLIICTGCTAERTIPATNETGINESADNNSSGSPTIIDDSLVSENEVETTTTENTESTFPKIKFANEFNILKNENVEQVKVTQLTDIYDILDNNGFVDIDPFLNTKKDTVHIGTVDDIIVGQFEVDLDNIVWNFRAEKAEKLENRTSLVIPEDAAKCDWSVDNYQIENYNWFVGENAKGLIGIELDIAFCPETKNLYTFYTKTVWEDDGEGNFENPSLRGPNTILMNEEYRSYIRQMGRYHTLDVVRVD